MTTFFDELITAAGLGGLITSTEAAIIVVAAVPLGFTALALYRAVLRRGVRA